MELIDRLNTDQWQSTEVDQQKGMFNNLRWKIWGFLLQKYTSSLLLNRIVTGNLCVANQMCNVYTQTKNIILQCV